MVLVISNELYCVVNSALLLLHHRLGFVHSHMPGHKDSSYRAQVGLLAARPRILISNCARIIRYIVVAINNIWVALVIKPEVARYSFNCEE